MSDLANGFLSLIDYFITQWQQILSLTVEHIEMTAIAVGCSILIGVPLGILISYIRKLGKPVIGVANVVQAIPSMALLGLAIPLLGIGTLPAVVMVIIYSLLPIVKNTYTGITNIDPLLVEAATGIGLTKWQVLYKVKLPLALPVIMAGVRISTVTAVGLMTMAAFIGAGGLGYLVFSGIRTVNNIQILAGAIPACILALLVDFLMGLIEKLVTPISLQKQFGVSKEKLRRRKNRSKAILGVAAAVLVLIVGNTAYHSLADTSERSIVIGSKDFTENIVLANLYGQMIEAHTDIDVEVEENLGGTQVCYEALRANEIDLYIDYTGTVYETTMLDHPEIGSVCSGGRYDNLAEFYTDKQLPGVGISIGLTRLFYVLGEQDMLNLELPTAPADVLVIPMDEAQQGYAIATATRLREAGIRTQLYGEKKKFKARITYASKLEIPYALFLGETEEQDQVVALKDLNKGKQVTVPFDKAVALIQEGIAAANQGKVIQEH